MYFSVLPDYMCKQIYKKSKPQMFCAGDDGKDACQGDSGAGTIQSKKE